MGTDFCKHKPSTLNPKLTDLCHTLAHIWARTHTPGHVQFVDTVLRLDHQRDIETLSSSKSKLNLKTQFVDMVLRLEHQRDIEARFERNDATYSIFWQQNGDIYQAVGQYGTEARRRALRR